MRVWIFFIGFIACSMDARANPIEQHALTQQSGPNTSAFQDVASLKSAVASRTEDYLIAIYGADKVAADIEYRVSNLDSRLKLKACDTPLNAEPKESGFGASNLSVKVRCTSGTKWTIYVPVHIDIYGDVAVSTRNLTRGHTIEDGDYTMKRTNTSSIGQNYIDNTEAIAGKVVHRSIRSGSVIKSHDVKEPMMVHKGDTVVLVAQQGSLQVSTEAVALVNGRMGEQIRVENMRSRRVVDARVSGPGQAVVW